VKTGGFLFPAMSGPSPKSGLARYFAHQGTNGKVRAHEQDLHPCPPLPHTIAPGLRFLLPWLATMGGWPTTTQTRSLFGWPWRSSRRCSSPWLPPPLSTTKGRARQQEPVTQSPRRPFSRQDRTDRRQRHALLQLKRRRPVGDLPRSWRLLGPFAGAPRGIRLPVLLRARQAPRATDLRPRERYGVRVDASRRYSTFIFLPPSTLISAWLKSTNTALFLSGAISTTWPW